MAETVQMNVNVKPETRQRIMQMAELTHRGMGNMVDWLVEKAWLRMQGGEYLVNNIAKTEPAQEGG